METMPPHAHPGMPPIPPDLPRGRVRRSGNAPVGDPPHFWHGGPVSFVKLARLRVVRARDGKRHQATHEVRWFLDRVEGVGRKKALDRLYDVLLRPDGWLQSGVHWKRVMLRTNATILVRVIPANASVCGPGSLGCYSYGYEADGLPVAEMGVELIDDNGPWNVVTGMELCGHGTFSMHDHYINHPGWAGSMGTWESAAAFGFKPSPAEIDGARQWLRGDTPAELIHDHD